MIYKRNRLIYVGIIISVMILGLLSRKMGSVLPNFIETYLGDALWALMIYFVIAFILRKANIKIVATIALCYCYLTEISQLYHADWIDSIRKTTLGGLVLGYGFLWSDIIAYTIGIMVGVIIEILIISILKVKNN